MSNMTAKTDCELVKLYEEGNDKAFDILLDRYQETVYSYILFQVQNEDVANDVFQDTFARAIAYIRSRRYTANGKFASWIIRIAHNLIVDLSRLGDGNRLLTGEKYTRECANQLSLSEESHEKAFIQQQGKQEIMHLINLLPQAQKEVVIMRFYEERSFKEIATLTGVSINTSLGRLRYALINLRKMIQKSNLSLVG